MNVNTILAQLDQLFAKHLEHEVEPFLMEQIQNTLLSEEQGITLTLLNELIGFYRSQNRLDDAIIITTKALELIKHLQLTNSVSHATTLLNGATVYRFYGDLDNSERYYTTALDIYKKNLSSNDYRFASLYNNMSSLSMDKKNYKLAIDYLHRALEILNMQANVSSEIATTHTNLACAYEAISDTFSCNQYIQLALNYYNSSLGQQDFHYVTSLSSLVNLYIQRNDHINAQLLQEKISHKNQTIHQVGSKNTTTKSYSLLQRSKEYFEVYGKPMLEVEFPEYVSRIAVGLVGHGSECFEWEDSLSKDHDYGVGFCLWLTEEDDASIGELLQAAYDTLPSSFYGIPKKIETKHSKKRIGVCTINAFYSNILKDFITNFEKEHSLSSWHLWPDECLATATNGCVFLDELGIFSNIRNQLLSYYPEQLYTQMLATYAALISQSGQYNYARSMMRNNVVGAHLALHEFVQSVIRMDHMLNRQYTPYYKWMYHSLKELPNGKELAPLLKNLIECPISVEAWKHVPKDMDHLNIQDEKIILIEQIVALLIKELKTQNLSTGTSNYLEHHVTSILHHNL